VSQQINLYSPIFRKQRRVFSAAAMVKGVGLITLVVVVASYYIAMQTSLLEIRAAESARELKDGLERLKLQGAGQSPAERAKLIAERRKALEASLAAKTQALSALDSGAAGSPEGYSAVLRALARLQTEGVWLTRIQFAAGGGELSIAGRATRPELIPAYLERLRTDETLRRHDFAALEITRPTADKGAPHVEFVLSSGTAKK
jgi:Tfp pilus assembly protein PilN